MASNDGSGEVDPALEETVSAEDAGVTPGGAGAGGGRLSAGSKLGRYEILEFIGGGGMGWVYRARDVELERDVAIKVVQPTAAGASGRARLLAEARAMARLHHRAVVPVFDVGEYAGGVYVAMALVQGGTLHDWMHAEPRPWRHVLARFIEAGRGLVAAHDAGIVHRDFKPRNVLVSEAGEVLVADFGIAAASADGDDGATPRDASSVAGTPAYMAPEQAAGRAVDARADQYSFCVSLWEGLHGERPQEAATRTQGARIERSGDAPKPRRRVPGWLTDAVARGFAPVPDKRWPTLAALLDHCHRRLGRPRRVAFAAGPIALAAVVGGVLWTSKSPRPDPCPAPARALEEIWGPAARARVEAAFSATGAPFASAMFARVGPTLDRYAAAWRDQVVAACRATNVEHSQSADLLDRRMSCLEARRAALQQLTGALADATRDVVAGAPAAVAQLAALDDCDRTDELLASGPTPSGERRVDVAAIRTRLGDAATARLRGTYRAALDTAEAALRDARALAWAPLTAEALAEVVQCREALLLPRGELADELTRVAASAKDDQRLVLAWAALLEQALDEGDYLRAKVLAGPTSAALLRAEVTPALAVRTRVKLATAAARNDDHDDARRYLDEAEPLAVAPGLRWMLIHTRGLIERDGHAQVRLEEAALETARQEYEAEHPIVAKQLMFLAVARHRVGDLEGAEAAAAEAMAIHERAGDTRGTPALASLLQLRASLAGRRGRPRDALADLERAGEIFRDAGMTSSIASTERLIANVYSTWLDDAEQGRAHYQRALEIVASLQGTNSIAYADLEASFGAMLGRRDCAAARPYLEHAIRVLEPSRYFTLVAAYGQLGECLEDTEPAAAMRYYEAGLGLCRARGCEPGHEANFQAAVGQLLIETKAGRPRGLALLREAVVGFEAAGNPDMASELRAIIAHPPPAR
ncbi:MAG: serine/threonine protein kinase [Myxococcales bacterium]|nr:serine/threonine protein kinase [Myxococcales bacterium]